MAIAAVVLLVAYAPQHDDDVCSPGYAHRHRNVPYAVRDEVYNRAGIPRGQRRGHYVIDHIIPLELGGSNDISNLQVQTKVDGARKDIEENELHAAVCNGSMTLPEARAKMLRDWPGKM